MPEATEDTTPTLAQELELRLAESRGVLSGNDELIATFLRDHLHELAFHTAESLAQGAGVSGAAVVRFARRLEFASFRELRDRARSELRPAPNAEPVADPAADAEPGTSTLTRKTQGDIASLELLPRLLGDAIETAAQVVAQARTAWFLANRETHGLAVYAHRLLFQARGRVALINPAFPDPIRDLGPDDALIACTFRPYARNTI
jgi:DNA-binding MurR/RpiR family transcriptional regulator